MSCRQPRAQSFSYDLLADWRPYAVCPRTHHGTVVPRALRVRLRIGKDILFKHVAG